MRYLLFILLTLLTALPARGLDLPEKYQPGDIVRYVVERGNKVLGMQEATCVGWEVVDHESLYVFDMTSRVLLEQAGGSYTLEITSHSAYYRDGRPRSYSYRMSPLDRTIEHEGHFTGRDYYGATTRFGVRQPFSHQTPEWPLLFDTHFGLQWEIAANTVEFPGVDSIRVGAVIPQADRVVDLDIIREPDARIKFENETVMTRVYSIVPANQHFYVDANGRLLRAVDTSQKTVVRRLAGDETAAFATEPLLDKLVKRVPGYALLLVFALLWMVAIAFKQSLRLQVILLFLIGALLYWPDLKFLTWLALLYERLLASPVAPRTGSYPLLFGLALLIALGEELAKFVALWLRTRLPGRITPRLAISLGAACGAGFAFVQGAYLTAFAADGSLLMAADVWQRLFVIGVNAASGAMIAALIVGGKSPVYYLIPLGVKTLLGFSFAFVQKGVCSIEVYIFVAALFCAIALVLVYYIYRSLPVSYSTRSRRRHR